MELSSLTRVVTPTLSRQLFMMAKQYDDVVDFTLGDPDVPTPVAICEAATKAALGGKRLGRSRKLYVRFPRPVEGC